MSLKLSKSGALEYVLIAFLVALSSLYFQVLLVSSQLWMVRRVGLRLSMLYTLLLITIAVGFGYTLSAAALVIGFGMTAYYLKSEKWSHPLFIAGVGSVGVGVLLGAICIALDTVFKGISLDAWALQMVELFSSKWASLGLAMKVSIEDLAYQIPSAAIMLMALALWLGLLSDQKRTLFPRPLWLFQLPTEIIWPFLLAVVGAFSDLESEALKAISVNALNICVFLYFLQGMAVVGAFFRWQRFSPMFRPFVYLVLALQMFLFVGALGLVDYWVDFRKKMINKSAERTREV